MNSSLKQFITLVIQSIAFWVIAFLLFTMFRYYGFNEEQVKKINDNIPITEWFHIALYFGLTIGFFYAIIEFIFDKYLSNKLILGLTILFKTTFYIIVLILASYTISLYIEELLDIDLANDGDSWWKESKILKVFILYFFVSSIIFSFIKVANEKFGRGILLKTLLGKYRKPKEEKRVFMFLDLKDSTAIAENLGHLKYSQFIQDCFLDLNRIINKFDAEVYQYVGDEAVLSWLYEKGISKNKCIDLFFAFQSQIQKRSRYYEDRYNVIPIFKAGLHGGKLMVAEVGTIKKELAFHGDVINTTARIQAECNRYSETLLISEKLFKNITLKPIYNEKYLGNVSLKGKKQQIEIYSINL